ncbi:MAG: NDP-sugar synthase [Proteobacteria bacterium]|nr:NDP-sugar synthase [Pseudomonadota bacterium]
MKAIILAAGFGTRLRPITDIIPKPLVPVLGQPLLAAAIGRIQSIGIESIGINAHYLSEKIAKFIERYDRPSLKLSIELPEILGSGGAFNPFREWLKSDDFLVLNGDILTGINFPNLLGHHQNSNALVTMSLRPGHNGKDRAVWAKESPSGALEIIEIAKEFSTSDQHIKAYTFGSTYCASSELFDFIPKNGPSDIIESIRQALFKGFKVAGVLDQSFWADVGTPKSLWDCSKSLITLASAERSSILGRTETTPLCLVHSTTSIPSSLQQVGTVIIDKNCQIGRNVTIENSILMEGSRILDNETISNCIVGPGPNGYRVFHS